MSEPMDRPKVGVAVAVRHNGRVLLGHRTRNPGEGTWTLPGGHLEGGESFEDCGRREIKEETGIELDDIKFWTVLNVIYRYEKQHYVVVHMVADLPDNQEAMVVAPDEIDQLRWFSWDELPWPLMLSTNNLVVRGLNPFEIGK